MPRWVRPSARGRRCRVDAYPEPLLVLVVELELLPRPMAHDLGRDLGPLRHGLPGVYVLAVAREQHAIERHFAPRLGLEQRDLDGLSRFGPKLGSADRENGVSHGRRNLNRRLELVEARCALTLHRTAL